MNAGSDTFIFILQEIWGWWRQWRWGGCQENRGSLCYQIILFLWENTDVPTSNGCFINHHCFFSQRERPLRATFRSRRSWKKGKKTVWRHLEISRVYLWKLKISFLQLPQVHPGQRRWRRWGQWGRWRIPAADQKDQNPGREGQKLFQVTSHVEIEKCTSVYKSGQTSLLLCVFVG